MTPLQPHPQQKPTTKAAATEFPAPSAHLFHSRTAEASSEGSTAEVPCAEPLAAESSWSHPQQNFSLEEDEDTTSTTEASHKGCRSRVSFAKGPSSTAEATHEGSRNRISCAKCAPLPQQNSRGLQRRQHSRSAEPLVAKLLSEPLSAELLLDHHQRNLSLEQDEATTSTTEACHKGCSSRSSLTKGTAEVRRHPQQNFSRSQSQQNSSWSHSQHNFSPTKAAEVP